jgi:hypothetical protein
VKARRGGQLPLGIAVKAVEASDTTARAKIVAKIPKNPVTLRKENGDFKVDKAD